MGTYEYLPPESVQPLQDAITDALLGRQSPPARVEAAILACFEEDYEPSPSDVAMVLCEEDVAAGEYEGCSSELDLAASEYTALASRALGKEN